MDCYCDYEIPEFYQVETRKSRKTHRCTECSGTIRSGETYQYVFYIFDGHPCTVKRCSDCLQLKQWIEAHVPCFCDTWGDLHNQIMDAVYEYEVECPGLTNEAKTLIGKIRDKRRMGSEISGTSPTHS